MNTLHHSYPVYYLPDCATTYTRALFCNAGYNTLISNEYNFTNCVCDIFSPGFDDCLDIQETVLRNPCRTSGKTVHDCSWLFILAVHDCSRLFMTVDGCLRLCMTVHDCLWLFMTVQDNSWLFKTVQDCSWLFVTVDYYLWLFMIVHDYLWLFKTVRDYSWLFMTAKTVHDWSRLFKTGQDFLPVQWITLYSTHDVNRWLPLLPSTFIQIRFNQQNVKPRGPS